MILKEWCKIWRKTNLLFQKWQEFGEFWSEHSKVSKMCTLIGPFCSKYITFDLKKFRGVIFNDIEESCKIWRKTDLLFGKWHEESGKFWSEYTLSLKIGTFVRSFYPKQKMYEFNIYRGVMCYYNGEWCKIWKEMDLSVQNWREEFNKFWPEHLKNWAAFDQSI